MSSQQHEVLSDVTLPHLTHLTSSPPPPLSGLQPHGPPCCSSDMPAMLLPHVGDVLWLECSLIFPMAVLTPPSDLCSNVTFSVKPSLTSLIKTAPPPSPSGLPYVSSTGYHHPGHNIFTWLLTPVSSTRTELQHVGEFVLFAALSPESTVSEWSRHMEQTRSYE